MKRIKSFWGLVLIMTALLAVTHTAWAQNAAPTKPNSSTEQYRQMLKDKQAQMAKQRADRAAQPRKAKVATPAATAVKDDPALKAKKEAAQNTIPTNRKAKAYVPTEADKKAAAEKKAKLGNQTTAKTATSNVKTLVAKPVVDKKTGQEPAKERTWQEIAAQEAFEKETRIAANPAAYEAMTNQPTTTKTITKAQLNKMNAKERERILAKPNEFKIID